MIVFQYMFFTETFVDWHGYRMTSKLKFKIGFNIVSCIFIFLATCKFNTAYYAILGFGSPLDRSNWHIYIYVFVSFLCSKAQNWACWPICQAPINVQCLLPQHPKKAWHHCGPNMQRFRMWKERLSENIGRLLADCISQTAFQKVSKKYWIEFCRQCGHSCIVHGKH